MAAVVFIGGIGGGLVFPILPLLGVQIGISAALIGIILGANKMSRFLMNPLSGQIVDRYGGKAPLAIGLFIESAATLSYSAALHLPAPAAWLLIGRAAWGIGSSFLVVGGLTAALNASTHEDRGRVTSLVGLRAAPRLREPSAAKSGVG